jgi:hypothetical protein
MGRITSLADLRIEPVLRIEPPGMFDDNSPVPEDPAVVQALFRKAVKGSPLAQVRFIPGSDILFATRDALTFVEDVARILSVGVSTIGEAELLGGYAFLNEGVYRFGVEDDSTLYDTAQWDEAPEQLVKDGKARIRHACDHFIAAQLEKDTLVLTHERSARQYLTSFAGFRDQIAHASQKLERFAVAFAPRYAKHLSQYLAPERARAAAYSNFKNRPSWIAAADSLEGETERGTPPSTTPRRG